MVNLVELREFIHVTRESWMQFIDSDENREDVEAIRKQTMTMRPLGTEGFITKLSRKLGRESRAVPKGRPKKERG